MHDEKSTSQEATDRLVGPVTARDEDWVRWALRVCVDVARRRGVRYARRLQQQRDPADAMSDLLSLAARRVVPLPERRVRALPRAGLPPEGRAFLTLDRADRDVLWRLCGRDPRDGGEGASRRTGEGAGAAFAVAEQEHAAAALMRWSVAMGLMHDRGAPPASSEG